MSCCAGPILVCNLSVDIRKKNEEFEKFPKIKKLFEKKLFFEIKFVFPLILWISFLWEWFPFPDLVSPVAFSSNIP